MSVRAGWVVVTLLAFALMHVPVVGAMHGGAPSAAGGHVGVSALSSMPSPTPMSDEPLVSGAPLDQVAATAVSAAPEDGVGHLGMLCLAIVLFGVVALGLIAWTRRGHPTRAARWVPALRTGAGWLRPPDLFSLCVLRR